MSLQTFLASHNDSPPRRLGQRYSAERFLPEAGNTVVCHLDWADPAHEVVLQARRRVMALPGAEQLLFTPEESLHMTVFEGVLDTRRTADTRPEGMALDAPVEEATALLLDRLPDFEPPTRFEVRADKVGPGGLTLVGASDVDAATMRAWRDALTGPFGYRHADHDAYRFHMTFAYPVGWIPDDLRGTWEEGLLAILDDLVQAAPVIPLQAPAFCTFADMTWFEERLVLAPK